MYLFILLIISLYIGLGIINRIIDIYEHIMKRRNKEDAYEIYKRKLNG